MMAIGRKTVRWLAVEAAVCAVLPWLLLVPPKLGFTRFGHEPYSGVICVLVTFLCPPLAVVFGVGAVIGAVLRGKRNSEEVMGGNSEVGTGVSLGLGCLSLVVGLVMCLILGVLMWIFHGPL